MNILGNLYFYFISKREYLFFFGLHFSMILSTAVVKTITIIRQITNVTSQS